MQYLALALAVVAILLALSIHLVMPNAALVAVRVLASEISPLLIGIAVVAAALAGFVLLTRDLSAVVPKLALVVAFLAVVLATIPLSRAPGAIAEADRQLRGAFPEIPEGRPPFSLVTSFTGLRPPSATVERDVPFPVAQGTLLLDRYSPATSGGSRPAMVVVHGGSWRAGDKGGGIVSATEWSNYFASRGYVVYDIQYRLAPAAQHPVPLNDVLCALAHVRSHAAQDGVDPERVILLGRSAGAHLALLAAYRQGESPCGPAAAVVGVVGLYPPTDLLTAYANPGDPRVIDGRGVLRDFLGGSPDEAGEAYADAMPRNWLRTAIPTLLIHGEADQVVYPYHSIDLAQHLQQHGSPVALIRLPWSGHGFDAISVGIGGQIALSAVERFASSVFDRSATR